MSTADAVARAASHGHRDSNEAERDEAERDEADHRPRANENPSVITRADGPVPTEWATLASQQSGGGGRQYGRCRRRDR